MWYETIVIGAGQAGFWQGSAVKGLFYCALATSFLSIKFFKTSTSTAISDNIGQSPFTHDKLNVMILELLINC